jgi:hypothetical protein
MKRVFYFLLVVSSVGFSQVQKQLGEFNKITSFDRIDVLLIPSDENKIILDGENAEEVELVNKNGELKVRLPITKLLKGDDISATIYFKELDAIEANEGSRIACESTIESNTFYIIAKEGSEIKVKVNVEKLTARIANGSTLTIAGNADNQELVINSGANFEGENLKTLQTTITVNAGGEANINASRLVDAKVRAGGNITIYGKPKQINQKTIAGGTIKEAN